MAVGRILLAIVTGAALAQQLLVVPRPKQAQLEQADEKSVLEAQRKQGFAWSESWRLRSEWLAAEKRAEQADADLLKLLSSLRGKYTCGACDLNWKPDERQYKWEPPAGMKFEEEKPTAEIKQ